MKWNLIFIFYSENKTNWGSKDYLPLAVKHSRKFIISCHSFLDIHLTRKYYAWRNFRITEKNISRNRSQVESMINICRYFLSDKRFYFAKDHVIASIWQPNIVCNQPFNKKDFQCVNKNFMLVLFHRANVVFW